MRFTKEMIDSLVGTGKIKGYKEVTPPKKAAKKKHKYAAQKVTVDGITFDSQKEYKRYLTLVKLQSAGVISNLQRQVPFQLNEGGTFSYKYMADFTYTDNTGKFVVEDSKGFKTKEYLKKKKLMLKIHGIEILES